MAKENKWDKLPLMTMKTYQLTDTSHQIITYKCIVKANSEEEAIKNAENWQEVSNDLDFNEIEAEEIKNES